jgi:hypothetical protein
MILKKLATRCALRAAPSLTEALFAARCSAFCSALEMLFRYLGVMGQRCIRAVAKLFSNDMDRETLSKFRFARGA